MALPALVPGAAKPSRRHGQKLPRGVRRQGREAKRLARPAAAEDMPQRPWTGSAPKQPGKLVKPARRGCESRSTAGEKVGPLGLGSIPTAQHSIRKRCPCDVRGGATRSNAASICAGTIACSCSDHARLTKDTAARPRPNVEHPGEGIPLQMRQPPGAVRLIRASSGPNLTAFRRAADRIRPRPNEALRKQALVLGTQPQPVVVWCFMLARRRRSSKMLPVSKAVPHTRQSCWLQRNVCMRPANPS